MTQEELLLPAAKLPIPLSLSGWLVRQRTPWHLALPLQHRLLQLLPQQCLPIPEQFHLVPLSAQGGPSGLWSPVRLPPRLFWPAARMGVLARLWR